MSCKRDWFSLAVIFLLWASGTPQAQEPNERTLLRPSDTPREGIGVQSEALIEVVKDFMAQREIKWRVEAAQREANDGSPEMILKIHLLRLLLERDEAALFDVVIGKQEELCWRLREDLLHQELFRQRAQLDVNRAQREIDTLAAQIVEHEDRHVSSAADTRESTELAEEILDLRAELHEAVLQREASQQEVQNYTEQIDHHRRDVADLESFGRRLEALARRNRRYVARVVHAVEQQAQRLVTRSVDNDGEMLRGVLELLATRTPKPEPPTAETGVDGQPIFTNRVREHLKADRVNSQSPAVEAELQKARERNTKARSPATMPTPASDEQTDLPPQASNVKKDGAGA